jgi:hypothetical protein
MPLHRGLAVALALLVGITANAAPTAGDNSDLETIEVEGSAVQERREILDFVQTLTGRDGEGLSSWETAVCLSVTAEVPREGGYVRKRVLARAAEVGVPVAKKANCKPNLFVVLTEHSENFIEAWKQRDPGMFRWKPRYGVSRATGLVAVRTWHSSLTAGSDGRALIQGDGKAPRVNAPAGGMGSRIVAPVSEYFGAALVLVDTKAAQGTTFAQLADYIAMTGFAIVNLDAEYPANATILSLFSPGRTEPAPAALTEWDREFLRALYGLDYQPLRPRRAIAGQMVRALAPR